MKKPRGIIIVIVFLVTSLFVYGQETNKGRAFADSLAKVNYITLNALNADGSENIQYAYFDKLLHNTGNKELVSLFKNHNSPIVKCYSFLGLAKRNYKNIFDLLTNNLADNRSVKIVNGSLVEHVAVADFLIDVVSDDGSSDVTKISDYEKALLDSILLFNDSIRLHAKSELLQNYNPVNNQYYKIKELAKQEYSPFAFVALAKFKREKDISLIINLLEDDNKEYYGLLAIREFPHEQFYDRLLEIHNKILKNKKLDYSKIRAIYQALVQYPTRQTVDQLKRGMKKTRGYAKKTHKRYIWLAIDKYPHEIFKDVKPEIEFTELDLIELEEERKY